LERNLLQLDPNRAWDIAGRAEWFRMHEDKLKRARDYLTILTESLPDLSLPVCDRMLLFGQATDNLGHLCKHWDALSEAEALFGIAADMYAWLTTHMDSWESQRYCTTRFLRLTKDRADMFRMELNLQKAAEMLKPLLNIAQGMHDEEVQSPHRFASAPRTRVAFAEILRSLGATCLDADQPAAALRHLQKSQELLSDDSSVMSCEPNQLAEGLLKLSGVYLKQGSVDKALTALDDAESHNRMERGVYAARISRSRALASLKDGSTEAVEQARKHCRDASTAAARLGLRLFQRRLATALAGNLLS